MDPGATSLRSQLVYRCGTELQNLTVAEVEEQKWQTKKVIFRTLMGLSPALSLLNDELVSLQSEREREVKRMSSASSREERLEAEKIFRSRFTQLVVRGLEKLRFPPALEPFADISTDLFHEPSLVRAAMDFLLRIGVPDVHGLREARSPSASTGGLTPRDSTQGQRSPHAGSSGGSKGGARQTADNSPTTDGAGTVPLPPYAPGTPGSPGALGTPRTVSSSRRSPVSVSGASSATTASREPRGSPSPSGFGRAPVGTEGYFSFSEMGETMSRLQRQNEFLSRQVRRLLTAQRNREHSESQLENIVRDLSSALGELAGDVKKVKTESTEGAEREMATTTVTAEEDALFQEEVFRRERAMEHPLGRGVRNRDEERNVQVDNEKAKSMGKVDGRGKARGAPSAAMGNEGGGVSGGGSTISGGQRVMWNAVRASVNGLLQQWVEARRAAHRYSMVQLEPDGARERFTNPARSSGGRGEASLRVGEDLLLAEVLGVKAPLAGRDAAVGGEGVALDIQRVHGLQRDLVGLAEAAYAAAHGLASKSTAGEADGHEGGNNGGGRAYIGPSASGGRGTRDRDALMALHRHATALLLHTSSFAPVAPLATQGALSSACTGLDALASELASTCSSVSSSSAKVPPISPALQAALDRARVEQAALSRSLNLTRMVLSQWPAAADKARLQLDKIGTRAKAAATSASRSLGRFTEGAAAIAEALRVIQGDRAAASQLGQLSKGAMGPAVASLVQALEVYGADLDQLPLELLATRKKISAAFEAEDAAVNSTGDALRVASERTSGLVERDLNAFDQDSRGYSPVKSTSSGSGSMAASRATSGRLRGKAVVGGTRPGSGKERPGSASAGGYTDGTGTTGGRSRRGADRPQWVD